jgi:L-threo-3-deoxy-hexylosonate aldolase
MHLIRKAREGLDREGMGHIAIVAGTGAPSTRESISLCIDAHKSVQMPFLSKSIANPIMCHSAGADAALVVPSGYYGNILKADMSLLEQHFVDISEASLIPV